jgi:hypothetical protein
MAVDLQQQNLAKLQFTGTIFFPIFFVSTYKILTKMIKSDKI